MILTRAGVSAFLLIDDWSMSLSVNLPIEVVAESDNLTAFDVCLAVEADNCFRSAALVLPLTVGCKYCIWAPLFEGIGSTISGRGYDVETCLLPALC